MEKQNIKKKTWKKEKVVGWLPGVWKGCGEREGARCMGMRCGGAGQF